MRLIDADALIEKIKDYPYGYRGMIEADIAQMPTISPKSGRWYAVEKVMPEPDSRVLVYGVDHRYHVWDAMPNRADNYCWEDEEGLCHDKWKAELWMPIPEV